MATRKLGRGKGALRTIGSPSVPGSLAAAVRSESPCAALDISSQDQIAEVRVTGITDVTSFWVQMGTAAQLEEFDINCLRLSSWCSERGGGRISLPLVKNMIAVRDKALGSSSWSRAEVTKQISDSQVEVLYVDTGSSSRVNLSEVCSENPPKEMLVGVPRQAVHCFLHGIQQVELQKSSSECVTERFRQLVELPPGSVKGMKNFVIDAKNAAITLYVQYEGGWLSVGEILKREGLVMYDPGCPITISDAGAMPSDEDATPTRTRSHLEAVGVSSDDGPTPVPSESSPLHFLPVTPPLPTSPTHSLEDDNQSESDGPPSLIDGSSVDTDSSGSLGRKTDTEDLEEQTSTVTTATITSAIPVLTISLPKQKAAQLTSMTAVACNQLKLPLTLKLKGKPGVGGSQVTPDAVSVQAPPITPGSGETKQVNSLSASPLPTLLSKPHDAGVSQMDEQQQQEDQQRTSVIESSTCTEDDDDDVDVIEIEEESELDTSGGGGEGEGEGEEKRNSASADTLSSDDEWDESLLPPRSESSSSSPAKNDSAEVEEYFRAVDMKFNRKQWSRNNSQKRTSPYRKNFHNDSNYQYQNRQSPAHNYHESLRRWGGYNSPPVETQDTSYNSPIQGRPPTWHPGGVGRGRRAKGGSGAGESNRSMGRGRRGGSGNRNTPGQGWVEEYPRPHPPPPYMGGIQQSQLVRKPGMTGTGRGGFRGVANVGGGGELDGGQSAPSQWYPSYGGGIRQSQLVKQPSATKQDFQRSSSSPSDVDNSLSFKPSLSSQSGNDGLAQREDRFTGGFASDPGGCGQTPPSQPLPLGQSTGSSLDSGSNAVYRGLTEEQIKNEVGWYTSAIERAVQKIVSSLTSSSTDQFASKILDLLGDSKAQKLLSLSSPRTPLEVIMLAVVKGALNMEWTDGTDVINTAIESLIDAAPHQACTFLQSSLIEVATEVSSSGGTRKTSQRFCSFLGRLFISASYSNKEDFSTALGQAVKECLDMWCVVDTEIPDFHKVSHAQCFSFLCEEIGPTIDDSSRDNLDAYFDKLVPENVLNEKLSKQVREIFLDLLVRRLNSWDGRKKVEPPSSATEAPPSQETTPTPTSQTPIPPPTVTDYLIKAQSATDHSSNVVQPVPVSAVAAPRVAARSDYQSSATGVGGGEDMQIDYGSVKVLSPRPSSLFMPTTTFHHQHPHVHRTHSLPSALQQQAPTPSASVRSNSVSDVPSDDPYAQITDMLQSLSLMDLLPRFEEYMIKDYVLDCENDNIKTCLQEASIPLGAVVGILDYIDKRRKSKKMSSSHQRSSSSVSGGLYQATPLHQMMPHPSVYSPPEPISCSSAPTPVPTTYLTQFQQSESQFPVIGSQVQADSATPTPSRYSMVSHYPQNQMKSNFEQPPPIIPRPSHFPSSPHEQQQFQYAQPPQLHQPQLVNSTIPQAGMPPQPRPQLQYQQSSQAQQPLPQHSQQQQQAQIQSQGVQPRSPVVSLPHSSLTGRGGGGVGGGGGGGNVATSPTTAQRRVSLPIAAASQRGPPRLSQLQALTRSHSQLCQEDSNGSSGTRVRLPRAATTEGRLSSFSPSSSSHQSEDDPAPKPIGGFGTIMCVCCGASDHKTPACPQRSNFFF